MTTTGSWTTQAIEDCLSGVVWPRSDGHVAQPFSGAIPFDLVGPEGGVTPIELVVRSGRVSTIRRTDAAPASFVSYGPPLLGAAEESTPPTLIRTGSDLQPLPPFDETHFPAWSFEVPRGGTLTICHELTGTVDGDQVAAFVFREGILTSVEPARRDDRESTSAPAMTIRTTWRTRLRWRQGEISTLEMASGDALRQGSWSAFDFALAMADRAQMELRRSPIPLAEEIGWLAEAMA